MDRAVTVIDFYPDRAFYRPGEEVRLLCVLRNQAERGTSVRLSAEIFYLADQEALLETTTWLPSGGLETVKLAWMPPPRSPVGYGVEIRVGDRDSRVLAMGSTAFDVLEHWTQAPRLGFVCDFLPGRDDISEAMEWLSRYHINGLQFYDWMYRHEDLLTEQEPYPDPLGRLLSRQTIKALIEAAHERNIAAMPYTAVNGASAAFYQDHQDWALRKANGEPVPFGENFLYIMDPSQGSPWTQHLMGEFGEVLRQLGFDGIHLDQYGDPKSGFDANGRPVDLSQAFPAFINLTKATVTAVKPDAAVVFNAVNNWPVETVAPADQDLVYIEVWPPHTLYRDLWELIVNAQRLSGGKAAVLAAYIEPARERNVRLADAVIFASGGYHIELGERGGMLADPYFPEYQPMSAELAAVMRRYYDFAVRYENVLALGTRDLTEEHADRVGIERVSTDPGVVYKKVWPIIRLGEGFAAISLMNLPDIPYPQWNGLLLADPTPLENFRVRYETDRTVKRVWLASPDFVFQQAIILDFQTKAEDQRTFIEFTVPRLEYWDLIVVELGR